jgi:hypothetical protein
VRRLTRSVSFRFLNSSRAEMSRRTRMPRSGR